MASIPSLPVFRQIAIGKNKNIFLLGFDLTLMCDRVLTFDDDIELIIDSYSDVEFESVVTLSSSQPSGDVYAQLGDGRLMRCEPPAYNSLNGVLGALQLQFPAAVAQSGVVEIDEEQIAFGLTSGGALYANDRLLTRNCTSMITTPAHLIFTTSQHLLKFVHLTSVNELEVPSDSPETDERCRSIERGARLVTVIPSTYSVVLQMPRGNLETIYPRALVLASIRKSTAQGDYSSAFMTCRSQRVDMNIIHDHDPGRFMESVGEFIRQVKKSEYIDLFLSSLRQVSNYCERCTFTDCCRDEDVSITMYKETSPKGPASIDDAALINGTAPLHTGNSQLAPSNSSKVNRICDTFLAELQSQSAKHLRNIITAHVCKSPPDLRTGLSVVAKLREQSHDLAERAAEHICFLADVNRLYDEALGLYDLDLTLLIAQQSQKDPREYLPYLQSLQEQTELRRKFTIDNDLGRHSRALDHLHALNDFDELKRYVQKHELYSAAIELYRYQDAQMNALMRLYANFLTGRNRFKEAGIAYEFLSDYTAASEAYRQANMWREALSSATLAPEGEVSVAALATDLAATCEETKDFFAAATIAREYKDSPEEAVRFFCKGYHFSDAIRLVGITGQRQWIEELVNPGLIDGAASMSEMLGECREQLRNQVPRLRELRAKKAEDPLAFFDGGAGGGGDVPDDMSIAPTDASTSGGTFMTRYTGRNSGTVNTATSRRTSKNRRREERKRARGKKGTVYEEEYLVNSIARLIERVDGVRGEVGRLVEGLLRRRMRERAVAVERVMGEVVEGCRSCVDEVFQVERKATLAEGEDDNRMGERPVGADGVLWDSLDNIGRKKEPPVVKKFERLSLLS